MAAYPAAPIRSPTLCPVKLLPADAQVPPDPVNRSRGKIPVAHTRTEFTVGKLQKQDFQDFGIIRIETYL